MLEFGINWLAYSHSSARLLAMQRNAMQKLRLALGKRVYRGTEKVFKSVACFAAWPDIQHPVKSVSLCKRVLLYELIKQATSSLGLQTETRDYEKCTSGKLVPMHL